MLIQHIQIENLHFTAEKQQHSAVVIISTNKGTVCLKGCAPHSATASSADIRRALTEDALRQIQRLPEFRAGTQAIKIGQRCATEFHVPFKCLA
ncbi:hypothetical protein O4H61_12580 [Roseovarius aestuarii]|nr:hypothetical protein [Roseovarius aestuarii]